MASEYGIVLELLNLSAALVNLQGYMGELSKPDKNIFFQAIKDLADTEIRTRDTALRKSALTLAGLAYSIKRSGPSNWPDKVVEKKYNQPPMPVVTTRPPANNKTIKNIADSIEESIKNRDLPTSVSPFEDK